MPKKISPEWAKQQARVLSKRVEELGLSQEDLGKKLGLSQSHVSRLLRGARMLGVEMQHQMAQALGWSVLEMQQLLTAPGYQMPMFEKTTNEQMWPDRRPQLDSPYHSLSDFLQRNITELGITDREMRVLEGLRFGYQGWLLLDDAFWKETLKFWRKLMQDADRRPAKLYTYNQDGVPVGPFPEYATATPEDPDPRDRKTK